MAIRFRPLPLEVFSEQQRPYIAHVNTVLRELTALEGVIRHPRSEKKRSDATVIRGTGVQVDVSRITPSITQVVSGQSTVVGTPALAFGTTNIVGTTATAVSINSSIALFDTTAPTGLSYTAATGSVAKAARRDHVHLIPASLQSEANKSLLTLTDNAINQTLTNSLGNLVISSVGGVSISAASDKIDIFLSPSSLNGQLRIVPDGTSATSTVVFVQMQPTAGSRTGMAPNVFSPASGDSFTLQPFRCWDAQMVTFAGQHTGCTFAGYDVSTMTLAPSSGSSGGNCAYGYKIGTFTINNTNATWSEVAGALFRGPRRSISSPTITGIQAGIIVDLPTAGITSQFGIYLRQPTAQATGASRHGIYAEAHNSGTDRFSFYGVSDTAYFGGVCKVGGAFRHLGTQIGLYGVSSIAQSTGWSASGFTASKTLNGASFSLTDVMSVLNTLITHLVNRGDLST